jgi:Tfp pilus assembly protein PilV
MMGDSDHPHRHRLRRGFTLMEALMASGILLVIVVAVTSAITAGQQHAFEAHQRIAASIAAEELMGRLITFPYADLSAWNGYTEAVGAMTDMNSDPLPVSFDMVGRDVTVATTIKTLGDLSVIVQGRTVTVRAFNGEGRVLASLTRFIPEPIA